MKSQADHDRQQRWRTESLFWLLHVGGWLGVFLVGYLSLLSNGKPEGFGRVWFAVAATGFIGTLSLRYLLRTFRDTPPLKLALLMVVPILVVSASMGLAYEVFARQGWCGGCLPFSLSSYFSYVTFQMYVVVGWCSLYLVITTNRKLRKQTEAALAATAMAHQAQLKMLRYQLNPHFLFNTLNAISTLLLDRDNATANRMVHSLSAFLRHSLDVDPVQRVTLEEEVRALELYLTIEKVRFGDRMQMNVEIDPECWPAMVPSLLLQPIVENAVKYSVARSSRGGTIVLNAKRDNAWLLLTVLDDGPGSPNEFDVGGSSEGEMTGVGVGLVNTRNRLRALYGDRHSFQASNRSPGGFVVEISLPYEKGGTDPT
ncbi:histidine kinase [Lysobacter sp. CFH 32150]|uniref:sensor histidine kinase n=1 Tax=Lysobacter sp. CFH 32150 TaxID=2927128 RepID=UPI001FA7150E|nr:histidine kinase [Lysobacter sp. CFH 32150]